jgi:hypothetical protein
MTESLLGQFFPGGAVLSLTIERTSLIDSSV